MAVPGALLVVHDARERRRRKPRFRATARGEPMTSSIRTAARDGRRRPDPALVRARRRANRRIAFLGHLLVWATVSLFLAVVAGPFAALVLALAWGIGLAAHGFFAVAAPELRRRFVEREVKERVHASVTTERRALEGKHSRSMEELAASVAHEIRNPVTAAKSLIQQIGEDPGAAESAEYARVAVEELDRVERAVSHLLRYAREEPLRLSPVHVADVVASALAALEDRVLRTGARIEQDIDPAAVLDADADKLRRVILNLTGNALDALEESAFPSPIISLRAGLDLAGKEVWLEVADNGPGIDPAELERIFDPFHTRKADGTGLGLAITRKLVEAHGGTLEVRSSLGEGATFHVTLPRHAGAAEAG